MKKVLLMLVASVGLTAQAQELIGKKTSKKATKAAKTSKNKVAKPVANEPTTYQSKNGTMKVHYIDKNEVLDTTAQPGGPAPHVNKNYSETQPALSPSNGNK